MFFLLSYDDFLKANFKKSIVLSYDILSDQNRYTHLKPLRMQGFDKDG